MENEDAKSSDYISAASATGDPSTETKLPVSEAKPEGWFDMDEDHNSYVYVTGLPLSMDGEEFVNLMKKCGVIKFRDQTKISVQEQQKGLPTNIYNIKMYQDKDGKFKGDALCCYARVESVDLALDILDGYPYDEKHTIHVEKAKFQLKGQYDPSKKPKKLNKRLKEKQKKKLENLLAWKPSKLPDERKNNLTVVISNMFSVSDFSGDPALILEYREDLQEECEKLCGPVKKIVIYDQNPDGVATVTFQDFAAAEKCIQLMDGRFFAKRKLSAKFWDGKTRYKVLETDEETAARLKRWHDDLEKDNIQHTESVTSQCDDPADDLPTEPTTSFDPIPGSHSPPTRQEEPICKKLKANDFDDDDSDGDIDKIMDDEESENDET